MESFLVSTGLVTLAEVGDKTQLLSLILAARFRRPWPIVAGILVATLANHAAAAWLGAWFTGFLGPTALTRVLGVLFLAMAVWVLLPDKLDDDTTTRMAGSVFWTTTVLFFLAEIGDKTQVATIMLAARYQALAAVVVGTTLGMMLANVPVVFFGERLSRRLRVELIRRIAAVAFAALGVVALVSA